MSKLVAYASILSSSNKNMYIRYPKLLIDTLIYEFSELYHFENYSVSSICTVILLHILGCNADVC